MLCKRCKDKKRKKEKKDKKNQKRLKNRKKNWKKIKQIENPDKERLETTIRRYYYFELNRQNQIHSKKLAIGFAILSPDFHKYKFGRAYEFQACIERRLEFQTGTSIQPVKVNINFDNNFLLGGSKKKLPRWD